MYASKASWAKLNREINWETRKHSDTCWYKRSHESLILQRNKYFLTLTLAHRRYARMELLKHQSEIDEHCHNFKSWIKKNTKFKVFSLRFDDAKKLLSLSRGFERKSIQLIMKRACTPQSNHLAEHFNETLLEKVRTMIWHTGLGGRFWGRTP